MKTNFLLYKKIQSAGRLTALLAGLLVTGGCNKLVSVPEPVNSVTTTETFGDEANATAALVQIYSDMSVGANGGGLTYGNGLTTILAGMSADELVAYGPSSDIQQFQDNTLLSTNGYFYAQLWAAAYKDIYLANAVIEGTAASAGLSTAVKNQLSGEAKFVRAYINFYLVNLFGDIPLITTTDWKANQLVARTASDLVYKQIIQDLKDAENMLPGDFSVSGGERYRPNKYAAAALLARAYLYTKDWKDAITEATTVISAQSLFSLPADLNAVFLKNSPESIFQLQVSAALSPYATLEGKNFLPTYPTSMYPQDVVDSHPSFFIPSYYMADGLTLAFDTAHDLRFKNWVSSAFVGGVTYYFPYKYKVQAGSAGNVTEYYTLLRLAEQYLIRAEAYAQDGKYPEAAADINTIRGRAGLTPTTASGKDDLLEAVAQERRFELFAEWGHRWLDLKRTDMANTVLAPLKPQWNTNQQLYPIPVKELQVDPNLNQNPGYQ
jgi:hypothetical protein